MITNKDIQKLIEAFKAIFPTREEVVLRGEFEEFRGEVRVMQTSVDNIARKLDIHAQEFVVMNNRVGDVEKRVDVLEKN